MRFPRAPRVFIAIPSFGFMNFRIRSLEEKKKKKRKRKIPREAAAESVGAEREGREHPVTPNITVPVLPTSCGNMAQR